MTLSEITGGKKYTLISTGESVRLLILGQVMIGQKLYDVSELTEDQRNSEVVVTKRKVTLV